MGPRPPRCADRIAIKQPFGRVPPTCQGPLQTPTAATRSKRPKALQPGHSQAKNQRGALAVGIWRRVGLTGAPTLPFRIAEERRARALHIKKRAALAEGIFDNTRNTLIALCGLQVLIGIELSVSPYH